MLIHEQFLDGMSSEIDANSGVSSEKNSTCLVCNCGSFYKSSDTLKKHQKKCLKHLSMFHDNLNNLMGILPKEFSYVIENKSIVFNCENFESWFQDLNKMFKHSIKTSSVKKGIKYITIICFHRKIFDCKFSLKIIIKSKLIEISPLGSHNHQYSDPKALLKNSVSDETKLKLIDLFYQGNTPSSALRELKFCSKNYVNDSKSRELNPNLSDVYYLYTKEKNISFGPCSLTQETLNNFIFESNNQFKIKYGLDESNHFVVAFATPKMLISLRQTSISNNIVCIDSSGGMDRTSGHLFNLVIPGPTGALSIGMFVTFSEKQAVIEQGLKLLRNIWIENNIIDKNFSPEVFMSDDCTAQINAIKNIFENSTVLLCQFHVLNAMWKWLQSNSVLNERKNIMIDFTRLIYSKHYQDSKNKFLASIDNNEKILKHINLVLKKEKNDLFIFSSKICTFWCKYK